MGHLVSMVELGKLILHQYAHHSPSLFCSPMVPLKPQPPPPTFTLSPKPTPPLLSTPSLIAPLTVLLPLKATLPSFATSCTSVLLMSFTMSNTSPIPLSLALSLSITSAVQLFRWCVSLASQFFYLFTSSASALCASLYFPTIHK